jgi:hypothetical protein
LDLKILKKSELKNWPTVVMVIIWAMRSIDLHPYLQIPYGIWGSPNIHFLKGSEYPIPSELEVEVALRPSFQNIFGMKHLPMSYFLATDIGNNPIGG